MVVLACGATAFQQPRARRALVRLNAEEPDLAELKSLFEAQPRAPRADDDAAGDDDENVAIFLKNIDLVVAMKSIQESSKSELSSHFFGRSKFFGCQKNRIFAKL